MMEPKTKKSGFLKEVGKAFIPKRFRPKLRQYLSKAGIYEVPYFFFGILFYLAIGITALIYIASNFYGVVSNNNALITGLLVFLFWVVVSFVVVAIVMGSIYFFINMRIYKRVKEIEFVLPDYLVLVSTNLKGGLSFEKSLWAAIRPEFGVLSEEVGIVSKKVMTGEDLEEALTGFAQKYDSPTLIRTINIIIGELQSGGQVASVLDNIIKDLRKTKMIKDEMSANTLLFTIFIGAIVLIISPLLFALSKILLSILINVSQQIAPAIQKASISALPFKFDKINVSVDDFRTFSVMALGVISIFSSMILAIIQKGEIKAGLKYMPFFISISIIMYFLISLVLGSVFNF